MRESATRSTDGSRVRHDHDCFGKVTVAKVQSTGTTLFGSALDHQHYVRVEVSRAHLDRNMSRDWVSDVGDDGIVTFAMSEAQWAQFISSFGSGEGTPVTLQRAPARGTTMLPMPELERDPVKHTFENEMREAGRKASEQVVAAQARLQEFLKPGAKPPSKKELEEIHDLLRLGGAHLAGQLGHIQKSFAETMEKTVAAAKADIEAYVATVTMQAGLEALRNPERPGLVSMDAA